MATNFMNKATPTKSKKKEGPYSKAQLSIFNAVSKSTRLKTRKAIGRRTGNKKKPQKRVVHVVNKSGPDIVGKLLYYNSGTKLSEKHDQICQTEHQLDVVNVSDYTVIDNSCPSHHTVVLDGDDGHNFIFAKVAKSQCNECLGGRKGLNRIRQSFALMKKVKPNQRRGKKATSISISYKLFGHRKDQRTKNNGEYVSNSSSNITNQDTNSVSSIYCNLSYNMEKASRRIGNAFYETGVYEAVQAHSNIPSVGVSNSANKESNHKNLSQLL